MRFTKLFTLALACALVVIAAGCSKRPETAGTNTNAAPAPAQTPGPLPDNGFKAQLSLQDPPTKLRTGQKEQVQVRVKNASDVFWWWRGAEKNTREDSSFVIAAGNRWLKADGSLVTDMDGRYGISKDLKPGEETLVPLAVTAPKEPGEYILEIDLVQEQVAWFSDKGSPTTRQKVTVVR
ncbi:MAG TPA: hypothetical protein VF297_04810 [Pyrinomonadaceae bacterium]